jgi:hypothetical protein
MPRSCSSAVGSLSTAFLQKEQALIGHQLLTLSAFVQHRIRFSTDSEAAVASNGSGAGTVIWIVSLIVLQLVLLSSKLSA